MCANFTEKSRERNTERKNLKSPETGVRETETEIMQKSLHHLISHKYSSKDATTKLSLMNFRTQTRQREIIPQQDPTVSQ